MPREVLRDRNFSDLLSEVLLKRLHGDSGGSRTQKSCTNHGVLFKSTVWVISGKTISEVPWGRDFGTLLDTTGDPEAVVGHPGAAPQGTMEATGFQDAKKQGGTGSGPAFYPKAPAPRILNIYRCI